MNMPESLQEQAGEGIQKNNILLETINRIAKESKHNIEHLSTLQKQADSIHSITRTIQNIATHTNLQAFEAARAGVAVREFDVVATEVRNFSNNVQQSISEVKTNVDLITEEINLITRSIDNVHQIIRTSQGRVSETMDEFTIILESSEQLGRSANDFTEIL